MPKHRGDWDDELEPDRGRRRQARGHGRGDRPRKERGRERERRENSRAARSVQPSVPAGRRDAPPVGGRDQRPTWRLNADLLAFGEELPRVQRACGTCRNWMMSGEPDGRGVCDHPGSGFSFPYRDTEACPFYEATARAWQP